MSKYYSETIQKGSKGDSVSEWQTYLNTQGYNLDVDGDFGDKTLAATTDYQQKNGLGVDGIVGAKTWGKAGYSDINTPVSAPTVGAAPTAPTFNNTAYTDTTEGAAKNTAKTNAENAVANYGDFTWDKESLSNEVWDKIFNRQDFSYDVNSDALYQQYKDKYITQGKVAMQDAMGQAAALTGGYGNSYAATAGNQAYQSHLQQLNDVVPELYQMAYDRYNQEGQELYNQYGMLMDDRDRAYGMWSDGYNRVIGERDYANSDFYNASTLYGTEQDRANNAAQQGYTNEFNAWTAANDNAWKQAEWDESARRDALNRVSTSSSGSGSGSGGSGGSSSGSGSGSGSGGTTSTTTAASVPSAVRDKAAAFTSNTALANYLDGLEASETITKTQSDALYAEYVDGNEKDTYGEMVGSTSGWSVADNGGVNWFWGVDNNAIVEAPNGEKISLENLVDKLKKEGMSAKDAKAAVKKLQKNLGI